jgi:predicted MPP superfamily phosphohydrolase
LCLYILTIIKSDKPACKETSHLTHLENVNENKTYDLLISIASETDCDVDCKLINENDIKYTQIEPYSFSNRSYYNYKFTGLTQGKEYSYTCAGETHNIKFPNGNKVAYFGDWSETADAKLSVNYLKENSYNAILNLGDIAYDLHKENGEVGNKFMEFIKPVTQKTPFMLIAGNHESYDGFNDYMKRFTLPNKEDSKNLYYSFNINEVHFIAINSEFGMKKEVAFNEMKEQFKEWFNKDLQQYKDYKWKVVYMHRPLYCSLTRIELSVCNKDTEDLREFFEPMFKEIDLVVSGHVHNYERTFPVYNNEFIHDKAVNESGDYINPRAPTYVVCGSAGNIYGMSEKCMILFMVR